MLSTIDNTTTSTLPFLMCTQCCVFLVSVVGVFVNLNLVEGWRSEPLKERVVVWNVVGA